MQEGLQERSPKSRPLCSQVGGRPSQPALPPLCGSEVGGPGQTELPGHLHSMLLPGLLGARTPQPSSHSSEEEAL